MKHQLIFATNNNNKLNEIRSILKNKLEIISLKEAEIEVDIPEPHDTLEDNATEKSRFIYKLTQADCFSEDTGLEVFALDGKPGVKSARYAGDACDDKQNINKLLNDLKGVDNRSAQFKTVISLIIDGEEKQFTGICKGRIAENEKGENGFGYDSIFIPDGSEYHFAEMLMEEKNNFSHRKKATKQLINYLSEKYGQN
jgi:XTP/dITP diphosphohydrolase